MIPSLFEITTRKWHLFIIYLLLKLIESVQTGRQFESQLRSSPCRSSYIKGGKGIVLGMTLNSLRFLSGVPGRKYLLRKNSKISFGQTKYFPPSPWGSTAFAPSGEYDRPPTTPRTVCLWGHFSNTHLPPWIEGRPQQLTWLIKL